MVNCSVRVAESDRQGVEFCLAQSDPGCDGAAAFLAVEANGVAWRKGY